MNKVYVIELDDKPIECFTDKFEAHAWAEAVYGSKADGICQNNVCVVAYVPLDASNS